MSQSSPRAPRAPLTMTYTRSSGGSEQTLTARKGLMSRKSLSSLPTPSWPASLSFPTALSTLSSRSLRLAMSWIWSDRRASGSCRERCGGRGTDANEIIACRGPNDAPAQPQPTKQYRKPQQSHQTQHRPRLVLLLVYLIFGGLHELSHLLAARVLLSHERDSLGAVRDSTLERLRDSSWVSVEYGGLWGIGSSFESIDLFSKCFGGAEKNEDDSVFDNVDPSNGCEIHEACFNGTSFESTYEDFRDGFHVGCGDSTNLNHFSKSRKTMEIVSVSRNLYQTIINTIGVMSKVTLLALGRYTLIELPSHPRSSKEDSLSVSSSGWREDMEWKTKLIFHAGWASSLLLAIICHYLHILARRRLSNKKCRDSTKFKRTSFLLPLFLHPSIPFVAYITAVEAIITDLLGFAPNLHYFSQYTGLTQLSQQPNNLICFCGNFGILLLNPAWVTEDGGKTALDCLEKMVNVTMMRGAQSGGLVTYEPTNYNEFHQQLKKAAQASQSSSTSSRPMHPPIRPNLTATRSRVVNAKRTDLSKRIKGKAIRDNCNFNGFLRGWDSLAFRGVNVPGENKSENVANRNAENGDGSNLPGRVTDSIERAISDAARSASSSRGARATTAASKEAGYRLVRGFYGHTRFATTSKATFEGTHPHRWSKRRVYNVYSFGSASLNPKQEEPLRLTQSSVENGVGVLSADRDSINSTRSNTRQRVHFPPSTPKPIGVENYVTHNGDFDFFRFPNNNDTFYDLEKIQSWLEVVLDTPMPASVDSCAIAGVFDLLRCQGCFVLSVRYALCLALPSATADIKSDGGRRGRVYPVHEEYEEIAKVFEDSLQELLEDGAPALLQAITSMPLPYVNGVGDSDEEMATEFSQELRRSLNVIVDESRKGRQLSLEDISISLPLRHLLASMVADEMTQLIKQVKEDAGGRLGEDLIKNRSRRGALLTLATFFASDEEETNLMTFVQASIDAFFDNDLLHSTRLFMENAKGSFGISVSSSLDAHRQVCFAAKGQTVSVAFYPDKGLICFGSEQAAVKAGMNYDVPGAKTMKCVKSEKATRLDLDDLGGEICLLDWGYLHDSQPSISPPNRNLPVEKLMNGNINVVLLHQSMLHEIPLQKRLVLLEDNEWIKPLTFLEEGKDVVLEDIRDIPKVCAKIQDDWRETGLNRMTAWYLANCIRARMKAYLDGKITSHAGQIDILVTGCEVSLWLAEQFASDLQKCFTNLYVKAISSNKLLGLFGQELATPCIGFPYSQKSMDLTDPIVIIVSHSGGTFGPLACSNLLQSFSSSIFAVTSEWDTQIGKQLRSMYSGGSTDSILASRIFSTEVGLRMAEPCSVSVVATHQLLTNIFGHIAITILSDPQFCHVSGAVVTERDLQTLERCNQESILALEDICGVDCVGYELTHDYGNKGTKTELELRSAGDLWAEHVLEQAKAYCMSLVYIIVTVVSGYTLVTGIAVACGMTSDWAFYVTRLFDALIYFWLPQINIFILRLIQRRNLRHRMVGRTVVIADVPWVAQSAEAFLSKLFACSYSIAGINVLSANAADHLVHRHTHRIVRGTLLVCGRPDGRLPALTSLEASVCLAVNQASSIQSLGGCCELITIGHNRSKLPLAERSIFLKSYRPLFLCEKVLDDLDAQEEMREALSQRMSKNWSLLSSTTRSISEEVTNVRLHTKRQKLASSSIKETAASISMSLSRSRHQAKGSRSVASLLGAYVSLKKASFKRRANRRDQKSEQVQRVVDLMIKERQDVDNARRLFDEIDQDRNGLISVDEFIFRYQSIDPTVSAQHLRQMFDAADFNGKGTLDFDDFLRVQKLPQAAVLDELKVKNRDSRGLVQVQASKERYFGEELRQHCPPGINSIAMSQAQHFSMELYESRIASLKRFVALLVMFHQMGSRVQTFFSKISFGLLAYRMDRTHSILRIATTASPVSGADVRERMEELRLVMKIDKSIQLISRTWKKFKRD